MSKRPGVRQSDLDAAAAGAAKFCALGLAPKRVIFGHMGGFAFDFTDPPAANDDLDAELEAFKARHGDD